MPVAKELRTNPALEAQVFWYKYRKEIAILLVLAIVAIIAIGARLPQRRCLAGPKRRRRTRK